MASIYLIWDALSYLNFLTSLWGIIIPTDSNLPEATQLVSVEYGFALSHYIAELIVTNQFPFSKLYCAFILSNSSNIYWVSTMKSHQIT